MRGGKKILSYGSAVLLFLLLLGLDQGSKILAAQQLKGQEDVLILPGVFQLHYLENFGAAFGIWKNHAGFFLLAALLVVLFLLYVYLQLPDTGKYLPLRLSGIVLAAGAVGNAADRFFRGCVIDFLYFRLIDFPVFNVADVYVVSSTAVLCLLLLFYYQEEDLAMLFPGKNKKKGV